MEDDAFSYNLSQEEVDRVRGQKYVDFGAIYMRQLKGPNATATPLAAPQHHNVDIPLEEWMRIFMAFQAEHVRSFPRDAPSMPGYVDLIIKMKVGACCGCGMTPSSGRREPRRLIGVKESQELGSD